MQRNQIKMQLKIVFYSITFMIFAVFNVWNNARSPSTVCCTAVSLYYIPV